ncbi:arginine--tRNA ligase [Helicovermis profundi]|uniref:Arginine--tRNA ligase n=1 Tax=Helicovermis profundi TaxID=3065157 RepID=A0AAU9EBD3_9FIRM|nr:arginine--tRNA ligase [Clostridia bacterium S502]
MINFKNEVVDLLSVVIPEIEKNEISSLLEIPKYTNMGDFAFPCFKLSKIYRKSPNMISKDLVEKISGNKYFEKIESVNAYINFTNSKTIFVKSVLENVNEKKDSYGSSDIGNGEEIIVEFSSTNIAKPFHMGHIRSTMIGNSLYKIHKFLGYDTVAINHLGDYGTQFGKLIVAYKLWGNKEDIENNPIPELLKIYVKFHEEAEKDEKLDQEARDWFKKLENNDQEAYDLWKWFKDVSLKEFNRVYGMLGVEFDSYTGESFYSDKMPAVLNELREKNILTKSKGAEIVDLEEYDMPPALVTKSDGSSLYITRDLAAAIYRKNHYKFAKNIYVVGSQQKLHFQQWFKIIELMGYDWYKDCVHVDFGMVGLEEGSLSTRKGRVVFLEDVLNKAVDKTKEIIEEKNPNLKNKEEVAKAIGIGAVVFQELSNNRIKDYTFSLEKTLSFEGETGPYVQYTHARTCSVLRKLDGAISNEIDYSKLNDEVSVEVIRLLAKFPDVVKDAARKYEPSLITRYTIQLAQEFNRFYHDNSILVDDLDLKNARIMLVQAVEQTLKNALTLIGLKAPEQM